MEVGNKEVEAKELKTILEQIAILQTNMKNYNVLAAICSIFTNSSLDVIKDKEIEDPEDAKEFFLTYIDQVKEALNKTAQKIITIEGD